LEGVVATGADPALRAVARHVIANGRFPILFPIIAIGVAGAAEERQVPRQDPGIYGLLDRVYVWLIQFGDLPEKILLFDKG
jgi:hypothetical protein